MRYSVLAIAALTLPSMAKAASSSGYFPSYQFSNQSASSTAYRDITTDVSVTSDVTTTVDVTTTTTELDTIYSSTSYATIIRDHRTSSYSNYTVDDPITYQTVDEDGETQTSVDDVQATSLHFGTTTRVYTDCNFLGDCSTVTAASLVASYSTTISGEPTEVTTFAPISSTPSAAITTSSSSSSSSPSSTAAPYKIGVDNNGQPSWELHVPLGLGPWNSVEMTSVLENANYDYDCSAFTVEVNGAAADADSYTISCAASNFDIEFTDSIPSGELVVGIFATKNAAQDTSFNNTMVVSVNTGSTFRIKRDTRSWTLSDSLTIPLSSTSTVHYDGTTTIFFVPGETAATSEATSADAEPALTSSSSSDPVVGGAGAQTTSTAIVSEPTTVLVTVTSCSAGSCVRAISTALETVVTTTVHGTATVYTTYCPLSSSGEPTSTSTEVRYITTTLPGHESATVLPINEVTTVGVVGSTTVSDMIEITSAPSMVTSTISNGTSSEIPHVMEGAAYKISSNFLSGIAGVIGLAIMML